MAQVYLRENKTRRGLKNSDFLNKSQSLKTGNLSSKSPWNVFVWSCTNRGLAISGSVYIILMYFIFFFYCLDWTTSTGSQSNRIIKRDHEFTKRRAYVSWCFCYPAGRQTSWLFPCKRFAYHNIPSAKLCRSHEIYRNSYSENCLQTEWNIKITAQSIKRRYK